MKLKQLSLAVLVAFGVASIGSATAQIPVTDVANIAKQVAHHAETLMRWKQQYDQMTNQLNQMRQQYQAITGARNLGQIFNDPSLRNYIPADWRNVYDQMQRGGLQGLTGTARAIYESNLVKNMCEDRTGQDKTICERGAALDSQFMANINSAFDQAQRRLDQVNNLMHSINSTTDAKEISEVQARINAEVAMIQNEAIKLQMYAVAAQIQEKMVERQEWEETYRSISSPESRMIIK